MRFSFHIKHPCRTSEILSYREHYREYVFQTVCHICIVLWLMQETISENLKCIQIHFLYWNFNSANNTKLCSTQFFFFFRKLARICTDYVFKIFVVFPFKKKIKYFFFKYAFIFRILVL